MLKFILLFVVACPLLADSPFEPTQNLPVAYEGRFRSLESASRLWLYDFYHHQQLKKNDLAAFHTTDPAAVALLWNIHFFGHAKWNDAPFFWVHYASTKKLLGLEITSDRFSFNQLEKAMFSKKKSDELSQLWQGLQLFTTYEGHRGLYQEAYENFYESLQKSGVPEKEIAQKLEEHYPFAERLQKAGTTLKMLPIKSMPGEWVSLAAFRTKVYNPQQNTLTLSHNFSSFSDAHFFALRNAYFDLEKAVLANTSEGIRQAAIYFSEKYLEAYASLAGKPFKQAQGKSLAYPTESKLQAETFIYQTPLIEMALAAYLLALFIMLISHRSRKIEWISLFIILVGFAIHTAVLALRSYILERPPVSNMFETVIYVPWIAAATGLIFYITSRSRHILGAAILASSALLIVLKLAQVDSRMENVQAVLDSQYWLTIHVLMIVASYGAFAVCGILGHYYLIDDAINKGKSPSSDSIARGMLHTMYAGVALLIPGTILGGVWAAESWGRFWDWDPKESWAFISACVYLLFIHAYTFGHIRNFGLAIGSIAGLIAISFTWYGVNYVLGTGLHSYGFGNGGEGYYFLYLAVEGMFLSFMLNRARVRARAQCH